MELSEKQQYIVDLNEPRIAVMASAAAGKTRVLTERVRRMLRDGFEPSEIAVITFTNMAAQELKDRLAADYQPGMYIGTIHGLANRFLLRGGINTDKYIKEEEFDKFFELLKEHPDCVQHIPHILLDECQDISPLEYEFIFDMIKPDTFFIVGDLRQSIYHFRGGDSRLFRNLMDDPDVVVCSLNENYRNGSNILAYAKEIIKYDMSDDSIPKRIGGFVYEGAPSIDNVYKWLDAAYSLKDWVILCTTNTIISAMMKQLKEHGIACITFKQGRLDKDELHKLMQTEAVKVLTYHSAKGLEFSNVIAWEPRWWGDQAHELNYMAATRAIDSLYWCGKGPLKRKSSKKKKTTYFGE